MLARNLQCKQLFVCVRDDDCWAINFNNKQHTLIEREIEREKKRQRNGENKKVDNSHLLC